MEGGCFCGAIRYVIDDDDYRSGNCHCTMCRRTSGAAFVSWMVVPKSAFRVTQGTTKTLESSHHGKRYFCENCGTPIACDLSEHPDIIDITICSLDDPEGHPPKGDFYTDTQLSWTHGTS